MTPTPFEQSLEADTAMVLTDPFGPGLAMTLVDSEGNEYPVRALYEAAGVDVSPGTSHAPVLSTAPMLHIPVSVVQHVFGRPLSTRDRFLIRGKRFRVQAPREDGYGMVACKLLEDGDA